VSPRVIFSPKSPDTLNPSMAVLLRLSAAHISIYLVIAAH
jgi:hypothetical protein